MEDKIFYMTSSICKKYGYTIELEFFECDHLVTNIIEAAFCIIILFLKNESSYESVSITDMNNNFIISIGLKDSKIVIEQVQNSTTSILLTSSFSYIDRIGCHYLMPGGAYYAGAVDLIKITFQSLLEILKENPGKSMIFNDLFSVSSDMNGKVNFEIDEKIQRYISGETVEGIDRILEPIPYELSLMKPSSEYFKIIEEYNKKHKNKIYQRYIEYYKSRYNKLED